MQQLDVSAASGIFLANHVHNFLHSSKVSPAYRLCPAYGFAVTCPCFEVPEAMFRALFARIGGPIEVPIYHDPYVGHFSNCWPLTFLKTSM